MKYYDTVKVKDIMKYAQSFYPNVSDDDLGKICMELELDMEKKMGELSLGNKKKVAIAQALIQNPKLLILDEPTNGLDPLMQKKLFNILVEEKKKGNTVFLSSHNLNEVQNLCDRVAVIKEGKIVDVIELEKATETLGLKITLSSKDINKEIILDLGGKILSEAKDENKNNSFIFLYYKDANSLVKELCKYTIEELLIEKENLEDTFLNYYENKGEEK